MLDEAIKQAGPSVNRPGMYVATHCSGGSHPAYTQTFAVDVSPGRAKHFEVVFQCRVRPVKKGEAWRIVDPTAIRPYGILLKTADT